MTDMRQKVVLCPPPDDDELAEEEQPDGIIEDIACNQNTNKNLLNVPSAMPEALKEKFDILKKRKLSDDEANRVAEEAQAMIRAEVRRLQNAVAELEAYLNEAEAGSAGGNEGELFDSDAEDDTQEQLLVRGSEEGSYDPIAAPVAELFPALPKVVIVEPSESSLAWGVEFNEDDGV